MSASFGAHVQSCDSGAGGGVVGVGFQRLRVEGVCLLAPTGEGALVLAVRVRVVLVDLPVIDLLNESTGEQRGGEAIVGTGTKNGTEPRFLRPCEDEVRVHVLLQGVAPEHAQQTA